MLTFFILICIIALFIKDSFKSPFKAFNTEIPRITHLLLLVKELHLQSVKGNRWAGLCHIIDTFEEKEDRVLLREYITDNQPSGLKATSGYWFRSDWNRTKYLNKLIKHSKDQEHEN